MDGRRLEVGSLELVLAVNSLCFASVSAPQMVGEFANFGHATDAEAVPPIIVGLRVQVAASEGEAAGVRRRGGDRRPEVATAGDNVDGAGSEIEVAGEWNRKWSLAKGLNRGIDMGAVLILASATLAKGLVRINFSNQIIVRFTIRVIYW